MMSSAAVTPNNMNGNGNKSLSPHETPQIGQGQPQLPQQALQNLQRILQSQLANVNPLHLQQALQRQQQQQMVDAGRKQLEQMLQHLQVSSHSCTYLDCIAPFINFVSNNLGTTPNQFAPTNPNGYFKRQG